MNSATSTESTQGFQPWHFFVIVTMLAASAVVLVARDTSLTNLAAISAAVMAVGLVAIATHRALWPLVSDQPDRQGPVGGRTRLALEREKALVLRSIKELEFDRAMGKIADADFDDMVARLRARAIGLLKQLEEREPDWHTTIEQELQRRLAERGTAAGAAPVRAPASGLLACAVCGTDNDADARFCKSCGQRLAVS
jgi:hypothetical protein